jgi:tetratricopeptide (TPR) repeat protein
MQLSRIYTGQSLLSQLAAGRPIPVVTLLFILSCGVLLCGSVTALSTSGLALENTDSHAANRDPLVDSAFDHFYNMDHDRAIQEFQKVLDRSPSDPVAVNHLLAATLMRELYRMGAMNTGEYSNDSFIGQAHRPADPKIKEQIKSLASRAETLEEQRLKANPDDVEALYARGVTRARRDHERVLEINPNYVDAKLVVGAHNYVMGSLPWSVKVAVALVGLSGSKEKGLEYLREVANGSGESSVDGKVVLALFLRREHGYDEARSLMHELAVRYPRNYLFPLEEANLIRASGHVQEAAAGYRTVWQNGRAGKYGALHYEIAALSLGDVFRGQKDFSGAAAAYELVSQASGPDPETLQKANLAAGEMYDMLQKRELAVKKYEIVLAENAGTPPAEEARKHIREAYRE